MLSTRPGMLWPLAGSEIRFQLKQLVFYAIALLALFFGMFLMQHLPVDDGEVLWSPYYVTKALLAATFVIPCVLALFAVNASMRDAQYHTTELVFSTGVTKTEFLLSRWLGMLVPSVLIYLCFVLGIMLGLQSADGGAIDHAVLCQALAWSSMVLVLPALLLASVLIFAIGLFSRSALAIYLTAAMAFCGYQILLVITGSPIMANPFVLSTPLQKLFNLVDPAASAAFYDQVKYWTPVQRNTEFIRFSADLLLNRLLVLGALLAFVAVAVPRFQLRLPGVAAKKTKPPAPAVASDRAAVPGYRPVPASMAFKAKILSFLALCRREYFSSLKTKSFLFVLLGWSILLAGEIFSGLTTLESLDVMPQATTAIALARFQQDLLPNFGALFLLLFSAEIIWRERSLNIVSLLDVTPVSNGQLFFAKWLTLLLIIVTLITVAIALSAGLQLALSGPIDWPLYLSLFVYGGIPLLCFATLFMFIHSLCPAKLAAMVVCLLVLVLSQSSLGGYIGLEHGMFKFGHSPTVKYSEMIGYSATSDAFWGYMSFWLSISLLLLLLGFALHRRGHDVALVQRCRALGRQWRRRGKILVALALVASVLSGANVYYQTNVVAHYQSSAAKLAWRAGYEKKYRRYLDMAQPTVVAINNKIALFPEQRRYRLSARYQLQNNSKQPIRQLLISTSMLVEYSELALPGARLLEHDKTYGQYLYRLQQPLLPGQSLEFSFNAERTHNGYNGLQHDSFFTADFIYFRDLRYMPHFGFAKHYRLRSQKQRQLHGLPPLPGDEPLEQAVADNDAVAAHSWAIVDTEISTSGKHTAVAPGRLLAQWQQQGRNVFHYRTEQPITRLLGVFSGTFVKSSRQLGETTLEVYHQAQHGAMAQRQLDAMADMLRYGNRHFSRYRARQLRLFEMPNQAGYSAYALPQMLLVDENLGFAVKPDVAQAFDHLYRRTVHETSHQWWGHSMARTDAEGDLLLVESLAKYSEQRLLAEKYGDAYVRRLVQYEQQRYFNGRGRSRALELPLYRASDNYLIYSKASVAMHALMQRLGSDSIDLALQHVLAEHSYPLPPATSLDVIEALVAVAGEAQRAFIEHWLKTVAVDDWQLSDSKLQSLPDGRFQADVCAVNRGYVLDAQGNRQSLLADAATFAGNQLQIGFFAENPASLFARPLDADTVLVRDVEVKQNQFCIHQLMSKRPQYVTLDPYYLTLDENRVNNQRKFD